MRATDYTVRYTGSQYTVTRMADGVVQTFSSLPQTIDDVIHRLDHIVLTSIAEPSRLGYFAAMRSG